MQLERVWLHVLHGSEGPTLVGVPWRTFRAVLRLGGGGVVCVRGGWGSPWKALAQVDAIVKAAPFRFGRYCRGVDGGNGT